MRPYLRFSGLLGVALFLCSCASISVVDTWRNPGVHPAPLHKMLVVSITKKDTNRVVYEDVMASELAKHGIDAVASHLVLPGGLKPEREALDGAVRKAGADSVLTVQTIKVERQTTIQPGYVNNYPGYWYPEAFPTWDLYGYYGTMAANGPAYVHSYDVATIQANVFETRTAKLVWAATVTSSEPENVISVAQDLGKMVAESLKKEKLIGQGN
jgi:hypothetical protein